MKKFLMIAAVTATGFVLADAANRESSDEPNGRTAAWIRFSDGPESYAGRPYYWLGYGPMDLRIDVAPAPGNRLHLHCGSRGDARQAIVTVNGREFSVQHPGHEGWQWISLELPPDLPGDFHQVRIESGRGARPAFFAEIRLAGANLSSPALPDQPLHRVVMMPRDWAQRAIASRRIAPDGEAFPEMRPAWDERATPPVALLDAPEMEAAFLRAESNARLANEAFFRSRRFIDGWLAHADPVSGLIPRNLAGSRDVWDAKDAAADNYPFMVLTAALTDRDLFEGRMREMLRTETRLTSRLGSLPDDYSFSRRNFVHEQPDVDRIIFGAAEYVKDGLMPLTEWLGPSPWSERMMALIDGIWEHQRFETPFGLIPSTNVEVNGELLQALSRVYWMTGEERYLEWAIRLGDYFLLGEQHPTRHFSRLRLRDHGCEIVGGLAELYFAVHHTRPGKKAAYRGPLYELYDRILEAGRNEHGLMYDWFEPQTGRHAARLADTWGYNLNGFYTVYLLDGHEPYREAVLEALSSLYQHYRNYDWENSSADGYADSIESAINLFNREPVQSAMDWAESEIRVMWARQHSSGVIEGWHGDGNFARTSILLALWKTQGLTLEPWRPDVRIGAVRDGDSLYLSLLADSDWSGRVIFDKPRHREHLRLPLDYPRINQLPEWFTAERHRTYQITDPISGETSGHDGPAMWRGIQVRLPAGREVRWTVAARD